MSATALVQANKLDFYAELRFCPRYRPLAKTDSTMPKYSAAWEQADPHAGLNANTTWHLVANIEYLRQLPGGQR